MDVPAFKAGFGEVECTPRAGLPLRGNFRDDYAARGTHDPLKAKALVIESAGTKVAIAAVDVCMLDAGNAATFRESASRSTGIPPRHVMVCATHTHAGPAITEHGFTPKSPEADIRAFLERAAEAVAAADRALAPADLFVGRSREDRVSFNRRLRCKDGTTHMNWEGLDPGLVLSPWGVTDPELQVLAVECGHRVAGAPAGALSGALVNFGLHPAVLAGDNWLYSADYPGYLAEALTRLEGSGQGECRGSFVSLFTNGCCGNVNHIDYTDKLQGRGYQMTQRIGYMLAAAAHEALRDREKILGNEIAVAVRRVAIKRLRIPEADVERAKTILAGVDMTKIAGQVDGLPEAFYAQRLVEMHKVQDRRDMAEVTAIRIGDAAVVGLPSEIFCELGLDIKKRSPARRTIVCELANDWFGYIPTRVSFEQGGYEPSTGSTEYVPGTGEKLVDEAVGALHELFG